MQRVRLFFIIIALADLLQPLAKRPFAAGAGGKFSLGKSVQGFNLPWGNADNYPCVADFDQDDSLPGTDHQTTDDPQGAAVAKTSSAIQLA